MKKLSIFITLIASLSQTTLAFKPQQIAAKIAANRMVQACTKTTSRKVATCYTALLLADSYDEYKKSIAHSNRKDKMYHVVYNTPLGLCVYLGINTLLHPIAKTAHFFSTKK